MKIPFNKPYMSGKELLNTAEAYQNSIMSGDGPFTKRCNEFLERHTGSYKVLLTHSCTAALELAALLLDIQPGDEIVMPSYTFVSTANAFVLRGAIPVFVDIREDTLNLDERIIEEAITPRTRAIVPVHYAGVACEMDAIINIARKHRLYVIEDAAQGVNSRYNGRALGSIGDLGAYSFHETKNVISGEGGAILVNNADFASRAEIIREKGTDRTRFFRGEVDKYTWQDVGSSFLPGELVAAFLCAQFDHIGYITERRRSIWQRYHDQLEPLERKGLLRRPIIPRGCEINGHIYYVLLPNDIDRQSVIDVFKREQISVVSHYVPLHSSPAGKRYGRAHGDLRVTDKVSESLMRLPLWVGLSGSEQDRIVSVLENLN